MTRFNPNKLHKTATDWSVIAYKTADNDKAPETLVIGLALGVGVASFSTPVLGAVVGAYFVLKGIQKACNSDKNKKYIREAGCVAHVLDGGTLELICNRTGKSKYLQSYSLHKLRG